MQFNHKMASLKGYPLKDVEKTLDETPWWWVERETKPVHGQDWSLGQTSPFIS